MKAVRIMIKAAIGFLAMAAAAMAAGCGPARTVPPTAEAGSQADEGQALILAELGVRTHAAAPRAAPAPASSSKAAPALSPAELLRAHNAWADSIQHLQSPADILISLPTGEADENGASKRLRHDIGGFLSLEKPDNLLLYGRDLMYGDVFKVGMNAEMFWVWVRPKMETVWVGRRGGEGERRLLLAPRDLMAALGLYRIELLSGTKTAFSADERHYCLAEDRVIDDEVVPMRRLWFDRRTLRPARVDLFDENGQCVLMAELLKYERVGGLDVCTVYRARFYGAGVMGLVLQLKAVDLVKPLKPILFKYSLPPGAAERNLDTMQ